MHTGPHIVTDGLVLYLDGANPKSYPGSGSDWFNLNTNFNDSELIGTYSFTNDNLGGIFFNGTDGKANILNTQFDFSTEQTIFIVLKPDESDNNRRNPYNQAYGGFGTITHESNGTFNYYHGTAGTNSSPYQGTGSTFTVAQNEITAITLTRNPSSIKWYKNGKFINFSTNSYPTAVSSVNDIVIADGYTNNYSGVIYCVMLYERALTEDEVAQNFNAIKSRFNL